MVTAACDTTVFVDVDGDGCDYYDDFPDECGYWDTSDFVANELCCACIGGGSGGDGSGSGGGSGERGFPWLMVITLFLLVGSVAVYIEDKITTTITYVDGGPGLGM